ncbi:hypothetical protein KP509_05G004500 [Ceratopteris richardii]|uniref:Peptidase A1 domain-containing protein n=1 Tax=Ceratopteris richardii TaxID=49495 RepID=A0A8T2UQV8_CERRI|nr:hypothetical protein KP509_05G004500 [Ceratopteris richardii]
MLRMGRVTMSNQSIGLIKPEALSAFYMQREAHQLFLVWYSAVALITTESMAGLVGMGQSSLSLPCQLSSVLGGRKFSYCLLSHATLPCSSSASPSSLVIGEAAAERASRMQFTPIVANPAVAASLYYIDVLGFSVNNVRLNIPASTFSIQADGRGGIILDSGTTYTYLPSAAFSVIQQAFDTFVKLPRYSNHPYLPLCYSVQEGQETTAIPPFTVHLQGMDLAVPLDNYFTKVDEQGTYCLAIIPSSGGQQIIGNMLHQHYHVLGLYHLSLCIWKGWI